VNRGPDWPVRMPELKSDSSAVNVDAKMRAPFPVGLKMKRLQSAGSGCIGFGANRIVCRLLR
jgi:hypothetical protein